MKRKSITALTLTAILIFSIFLIGCGNTSGTRNRTNFTKFDTIDGTNDNPANIQNGTNGGNSGNIPNNPNGANNNMNNATDSAKNGMQSAADSIKYTAENLKTDITNAGYKLTESVNTKKNYFRGNETDYLLGGDMVRVYEYNSPAELEGDINRIASNGMIINGTNANYTNKPYYYRKGNTLIVYEGREPAYIDEFGKLYGNTLRP